MHTHKLASPRATYQISRDGPGMTPYIRAFDDTENETGLIVYVFQIDRWYH